MAREAQAESRSSCADGSSEADRRIRTHARGLAWSLIHILPAALPLWSLPRINLCPSLYHGVQAQEPYWGTAQATALATKLKRADGYLHEAVGWDTLLIFIQRKPSLLPQWFA